MKLIGVALKNVFRNKRRSILNIIALTIASALMLLGLGWVEGYHTYIYKAMQNFESGEVQVIPAGYLDEARRLPLDYAIPGYRAEKQKLKSLAGVREATGRIDFSLRLSNRSESVYLLGRAIDPESEANTTVLKDYIVAGKYLSQQTGGILIGQELADRMDVHPGDTVYVVARDSRGVENMLDLPVAGIFHFGFPPIDKNVVFLDLPSAMNLLDMNDTVTRIVLRFNDGISPDKGVSLVTKSGIAGTDGKTEVHTWKTFAQGTVSAVQADSGTFYGMLVILYFLIVLGILNSMSMSVHERTREIGTLKAIGMKRRDVVFLLLLESGILSLIAAAIAIALSIPMIWYLGSVGVDIASQMPENIPVPFGKRFYADFRLWHYVFSIAVAGFSAIIGTLRPAFHAARLPVADAMRGGGLG